MNTDTELQADHEESLNGFEWLQVESMRLMEENGDAGHGICGNEWFVVEQLWEAEEAGAVGEMLHALRDCACPQVAEMADSILARAMSA